MPKLNGLLLVMLWLTACVVVVEPEPIWPPVSPIIPNQVPVMLENQWRLTEVIYNEKIHNFDSIRPILITFQPGFLSSQACNSQSFLFDTTDIGDINQYQLILDDSTSRLCPDGEIEPEGTYHQALLATTHYEIVEDTLVLSGPHARLTFVIDNEAAKPPDWS